MWVGSPEMTDENPVRSHGGEPRGAAQILSELTLARTARLCALATLFGRGGCTLGVLGGGDFVHWRPRSKGTLHTEAGRHCTNPLQNDPSSAQSPRCRLRALYKPPPRHTLQCANSYRNTPTSAQGPSSSRHRVPQQAPNISHVLRGHTLFGRAPFAIQAGTLPEGFRTACSGAMSAARVYAGYTCKQRG